MKDKSFAQLRASWQAACRTGQANLRNAAKRLGIKLTIKEAADFVRAQPVAQDFAAPPQSAGKVTAPELNERWQGDLIDFKDNSPKKTAAGAPF